jgi:lipopolysaccharide export system permease protein
MFNYRTLSLYLFSLYFRYFIFTLIVCASILALSNAFDILQKFKGITLSSRLFWHFVLYKVPYLLNEIAPLLSFITMLFFVTRLTKYNELIIILGSGISLQRVLLIPIVAAGIIGILIVAVLNPIGTYGLHKYEYLEAKLTKKKHKSFLAVRNGVLVFEDYNNENKIISAKSLNIATGKFTEVTMLFVDPENNFLKRIDAENATLNQSNFYLNNVREINDVSTKKYSEMVIPTNLTTEYFTHSLVLPEMISIWDLKNSINKFSSSGLAVLNYKVYYYKQLFKPLLMIGTVILASCFIKLNQRNNSQKKLFVYGVILGFIIYSMIEVISRILAYNGLEPLLAIMLPITLLILISNFVVLHLNEA